MRRLQNILIRLMTMDEYENIEPRYVQAVQIGDNVTDIYGLPYCDGVVKDVVQGNVYLFGTTKARKGDWVVIHGEGRYSVVPNEFFVKKYRKKV